MLPPGQRVQRCAGLAVTKLGARPPGSSNAHRHIKAQLPPLYFTCNLMKFT